MLQTLKFHLAGLPKLSLQSFVISEIKMFEVTDLVKGEWRGKRMDIDNLRQTVKAELISLKKKHKDSTIPNLCQKLGVKDEFDIITAIGDLEVSGDAELVGFKTVYREDGGAILLARYSGKANS